jgi:hypothetical protein
MKKYSVKPMPATLKENLLKAAGLFLLMGIGFLFAKTITSFAT